MDFHTVEENIFDLLAGYSDEYKLKRCTELLRILDLTKFRNQTPKVLSAGQRQRVSIARALAEFPKLLLLDEPFSNLDMEIKDVVFDYIRKQLKQSGTVCVFVTHQPEEALKSAHQMAVMQNGRIIQTGNPREIFEQPASAAIARLFGKYYEIEKSDFENTAGIKFNKKKKAGIRPSDLFLVNKNPHLKVQVTGCLFGGSHFEVLALTGSGKRISFLHHEPIEPKMVQLKIR